MYKEIDLTAIKTYVVGMASEETRNTHMAQMCAALKLDAQFVQSISCTPGYYGCSIGHLRALYSARKSGNLPCLILENDCGVTNRFSKVIQVPNEADIVYVGNSSCGCIPELNNRGVRGCALVSETSDYPEFYRTDNMAATHAILYLSEEGVDAAIESTVESLAIARAVDVGFIVDLQSRLNVYNFRQPLFFQSEKLQGESEHASLMQVMTLQENPKPRPDGTKFKYRRDNLDGEGRGEEEWLELKSSPDQRQQYWQFRHTE